jgi:hypothetical protein
MAPCRVARCPESYGRPLSIVVLVTVRMLVGMGMAVGVIVLVTVGMCRFRLYPHGGLHGVGRFFRRFYQRHPRGRRSIAYLVPSQVSRQGFVLGEGVRLFPYPPLGLPERHFQQQRGPIFMVAHAKSI